jgi:hypothetical protein
MNAVMLWRWLRSELLCLALVGFVLLGLPHFIDPLSHLYLKDIFGWVLLWFVIALVRTGVGVWWRRRRLRDRHAVDYVSLRRDQA